MPWLATVQPRVIIWHIDYLQQFLSNMSSVGRCNSNTIFKPENRHRRALGVAGKFNGISISKHQLFQKGGLAPQVFCKGRKEWRWINKSRDRRVFKKEIHLVFALLMLPCAQTFPLPSTGRQLHKDKSDLQWWLWSCSNQNISTPPDASQQTAQTSRRVIATPRAAGEGMIRHK